MATDESRPPLTLVEDAIAPTDGSAAELNEDATCIVQGCTEDPVTHRSMRVSLPVFGPGPDGENMVVDRIEQTVQVALCATHAEALDAPERTIEGTVNITSIRTPKIEDYRSGGTVIETEVDIDETTGKIV